MEENLEKTVPDLLEEYFNGAKKDSLSLRDGVLDNYPLHELAKDMADTLRLAFDTNNAKLINALMPYVFAKKATPIQPIQTENIQNMIAFLASHINQKALPDNEVTTSYQVVAPNTYRPVYHDPAGIFQSIQPKQDTE